MPNTGYRSILMRTEIENAKISEINENSIGFDASERNKKNKSKIIIHIYNYLKDAYSKILRYKNDIKNLESHLKMKTAPQSLYYNHFPAPLLKHDAKYIFLHNKIISETQIRIMNETIDYMNKCIQKLEEETIILKRSLTHFVNDADERVKNIYSKEIERIHHETSQLASTDSRNPEFNYSFYRAYHLISKPFDPQQFETNRNSRSKTAISIKLPYNSRNPRSRSSSNLNSKLIQNFTNKVTNANKGDFNKNIRTKSKSIPSRLNRRSSSSSK